MGKKIVCLLSLTIAFSVVYTGCNKKEGSSASNQEAVYPTKTIQLVIPYKPGGDTDLSARALAAEMTNQLGEEVVVVNMTGAGGAVASQHVKDADPDGYTVLYWHPSFILNKLLGVVDYDHSSFEVAGISAKSDTDVMVINSNASYETLEDFINAAKAEDKSVKYAASVGAYSYAQAVAIEQATDAVFNKVDIGGQSEKTAAVLGGHLDTFVGMYGGVKDYVDTGDFKVLGQFAPERSSFLPDIPTLKEQGVDVSFTKFYFTAFPKGTPQEIVTTWNNAIKATTENADYEKALANVSMVPDYYNPQDAYDYITKQFEFYEEFKEAMLSAE